jgi:hypothetical protein
MLISKLGKKVCGNLYLVIAHLSNHVELRDVVRYAKGWVCTTRQQLLYYILETLGARCDVQQCITQHALF